MKIKEWLEKQGLTLEDEVPEELVESLTDIPEDVLEGLSKESLQKVRAFAMDSNNIESIKQFSGWLRSGDTGLYNTGQSVSEAMEKINKDLFSIRTALYLTPVLPMEYICYKYGKEQVAVLVRFKSI